MKNKSEYDNPKFAWRSAHKLTLLGRYRSSGSGCNSVWVGGDGSVFAASSNRSQGLKPPRGAGFMSRPKTAIARREENRRKQMLAAWGHAASRRAWGERSRSGLVALRDDVLFVFGRGRGCGYDGVAIDLGKLLLIRGRIKEFMARVTPGIEPEHHGLRLHCASRGEGDGRVTNGGVRTASVYGEDRRI